MPINEPAITDALRYLTTPVRNNFFYGKLLTDQAFQREHWYGQSHIALLSRLVIGQGVLGGLAPLLGPDGRLAFQAGAAIDPVGRMVVVPATTPSVDPRFATDDQGNPIGGPLEGLVVTISLAYYECLAEPVPTLATGCDPRDACAPDVIRERYKLLVRAEAAPDQVAACPIPGLFTPLPDSEALAPLQPALADRASAPIGPVVGLAALPLARVTLPAAGMPIDISMIDGRLARPIVHTNQQLFELIVCLAEQVASAARRRTLSVSAGDSQLGAPDADLAAPIVVAVLNGAGQPVVGEMVSFAVRLGGGALHTADLAPAPSLELATDALGQASVSWRLGPTSGPQIIEASLATGVRASCYAAAAAAPQIIALWPPRGIALRQDATPAWWELWSQSPRLQIITDRPLTLDLAGDPAGWARVWHLPADYQPGQPLGAVGVLTAQPLATVGIINTPGAALELTLAAGDLPAGVVEARFLIQIRTDLATPGPVAADGQPIDADFAGSGLTIEQLQAIWDTGACDNAPVRANAAASTGASLPSGDGKAGGVLHSWFDVIQG
jgi:hypothetical protein